MGFTDGSLKFDTAIDGKGFEKGLSIITKTAIVGITAVATIIASAGTAVITYGGQMEASMAQVSTIVSGTAAQCNAALTSIQADLMATSNTTGVVATEMAAAAYEALSASVAVKDVGEFVDLSAKLAVGGFTTVSSSVDVLTSVVNAYGAEVVNAEKAAKILMQTQNKGKTTIDQLSASMANVTPTAAAMNVSFEQVGAALATMTAQGIPTAGATTQLNQLFAELGKSGTVASDGLAEALIGTEHAGKSFSTLMSEGVPLSDLLVLLSQHAQSSGKEMLDMFGSIEAGKSALALINKEGQTYSENLAAMSTGADVVTAAYDKMMDTFSAKKQVFITSMQNVASSAYKYIEEPLKKAADIGIKSVAQLGNYVNENGDKIIDTGKNIIKTLGLLTTALIAVKTAFLISATITTFTKSMSLAQIAIDACTIAQGKEVTATILAANGIKAKAVIMGVFTGQVGLATAATTIFNAALTALCSPVGIAITAIALLTAGAIALSFAQEKEITQSQLLIEESKEHSEKLNTLRDSYDAVRQAALDKANDELSHIDNTKRLWQELQSLADENGNVAEASRIRANFIVTELSDALGKEISLTNGQIENYQTLQDEIANTIQLKRAETLLSVAEDGYTEAIEKRSEAEKAAANLYIELQEAKKAYASDSSTLEALQAEIDLIRESEVSNNDKAFAVSALFSEYSKLNGETIYQLQERIKGEDEALTIIEESYHKSQGLLQTYYSNIEAYQTNYGLLLAGNVDEACANLERQNQGFLTASNTAQMAVTEQTQAIAQQYAEAIISLSNYAEQYAAGTAGYTQAGLQELQDAAILAKEEADKVGVSMISGQVEGINGRKIDLTTAIKNISQAGVDTTMLYVSKYKEEGKNAAQGYINGIIEKIPEATAAGDRLAQAAIGGLQKRQRSNSPAKALIEKGHDNADGYIIGIKDRLQAATFAGEQLASAAVNSTKLDTTALGARLKAAVTSTTASTSGSLSQAATPIASQSTIVYDYSRKAELSMDVKTHDSLSESELTRQAEDLLDKMNWEVK